VAAPEEALDVPAGALAELLLLLLLPLLPQAATARASAASEAVAEMRRQ